MIYNFKTDVHCLFQVFPGGVTKLSSSNTEKWRN